ncbi:MAG: dihydrolipoyl dehydrogenase [Chloroflexi bacterium]|nr:dihydrolipoyl dehydrogenase [Chloroflexota bacterium]
MPDYDVVVIGAGPGGYVGAIRAAQLGLKTAIIDREWLGGVCLNIGCIPSKALLKNAELAHILRERGDEFGFAIEGLELDYGRAVERSREVSDRLVKGVGFLMKKNEIDVHMGDAVLRSPHSIAVRNSEGEETEIEAKNIIIATGASAASIPGLEIDGQRVLTYREAILQTQVPKSVLIVGSGAVGLEFATLWNGYGVEVSVVEMLPRIAPLEDEEVSTELAKEFHKRGIKIMAGTKVESIEVLKTKVKATVSGESGEDVLQAAQALVAIGFRPNTAGIGLEDLGVQLNESGMVEIDERMATNVAGIWAIGDVTGKLQLAHVAMVMGIVCSENIAGVETIELNYEMMPRATFSHPQVASFGMTEAQAEQRGYEVHVGRFPFLANGKSLGMGENAGWIKLISDARYGEILGAHLIGPDVTELLPELTLAQSMELTLAEIARNVHAHPTLSEAIMEAAHVSQGQAIHI